MTAKRTGPCSAELMAASSTAELSRLGRVYVVDDDPLVLQALARLFRSLGLQVQTFGSAAAFLELPRHDVPSCLVLDVMLPELTGLDVQERLTSMGADLPIVFISGQSDAPAVASAMRRGAVDFLVKPTSDMELTDAVLKALSRDVASRRQREIEQTVRARLARLTTREHQVCRLVAEGLLNKQIAAELGTAEKTIKTHRGRMMRKLEVQSVAALVRLLAHVPEPITPSPPSSSVPSPPARSSA